MDQPPVSLWFLSTATGLDRGTSILMVSVLSVLGIAYGVAMYLRRLSDSSINPALVRTFMLRVRAWWVLYAILTAAFLIPIPHATVVLFFLISFWALREFITLTPTRMGDHRALFWVFILFTPLQYWLVGLGIEYYRLYSIVIPVFAFLFIPARIALAGDYKRFLERAAKIQSGLFVCVYALSYAPALLDLNIKSGSPAGLLLFLVMTVQMNDVFQYAWGKSLGRHVIAPAINASRTWEGFLGGVCSTALVGTALWWMTPFRPYEAAYLSIVIAVMGFAGTMTLSAIKRDRGVKDYGTLVEGHAGILDRIDSLCFAAPVFFHLTFFYFAA
jgi:phosphatidate cytidylyltransferase